jgi:hypothetical protein
MIGFSDRVFRGRLGAIRAPIGKPFNINEQEG